MRKALHVLAASAGAVALVLAGTAVAYARDTGGSRPYTCAGGHIPSGNYASIRVTGPCDVATDAVISVVGNVYVAAGASLDAQSAPSRITVGRNVIAASGALLGLGCQPDTDHAGHPCMADPDGHSRVLVKGNVTAVRADTVLLNGVTVKGDVTLVGGGGDIPWAIKNNTIGGDLTIGGVTADWLGVLFNTIRRNAILIHITVTDPGDDGRTVAVVVNTIGRNLVCFGLAPGVSGGFIPGEVNFVGGQAFGQCASLV